MKKFRCPVCGKKTLTPIVRFRMQRIHFEQNEINDRYNRHNYGTRIIRDDCCPQCDRALVYALPSSYSLFMIIQTIIIALAYILMFISLRSLDWFYLVLLPLGFLILFVAFYITHSELVKQGPLEYVDDKGINKPVPNARVKIVKAKYIRPYRTYGLKFSEGVPNQKFNEAFCDGLVPAVFLPDQNNDSEFEIYIINKTVLNDDMFYKDAEFLVEDANGKFITKGVVKKTELEW